MIEIMGGFPIIENLVAVLDGGKDGSGNVSCKENAECDDRFNLWWLALRTCSAPWAVSE